MTTTTTRTPETIKAEIDAIRTKQEAIRMKDRWDGDDFAEFNRLTVEAWPLMEELEKLTGERYTGV